MIKLTKCLKIYYKTLNQTDFMHRYKNIKKNEYVIDISEGVAYVCYRPFYEQIRLFFRLDQPYRDVSHNVSITLPEEIKIELLLGGYKIDKSFL